MSLEGHRLIQEILKAAQSVHSKLGCGFIENVYSRAVSIELKNTDFRIEREKLIKIWYGSKIVGKHFLDLVINETVIIELKAARGIMPRCSNEVLPARDGLPHGHRSKFRHAGAPVGTAPVRARRSWIMRSPTVGELDAGVNEFESSVFPSLR